MAQDERAADRLFRWSRQESLADGFCASGSPHPEKQEQRYHPSDDHSEKERLHGAHQNLPISRPSKTVLQCNLWISSRA
jgi:hypothetical protein